MALQRGGRRTVRLSHAAAGTRACVRIRQYYGPGDRGTGTAKDDAAAGAASIAAAAAAAAQYQPHSRATLLHDKPLEDGRTRRPAGRLAVRDRRGRGRGTGARAAEKLAPLMNARPREETTAVWKQ